MRSWGRVIWGYSEFWGRYVGRGGGGLGAGISVFLRVGRNLGLFLVVGFRSRSQLARLAISGMIS